MKKTVASLFLAILLGSTSFVRINFVYRDNQLPFRIVFIPSLYKDKIQLIDKGPAKGLYTGTKNKSDYDKIYTTLSNINAKNGETLFFS